MNSLFSWLVLSSRMPKNWGSPRGLFNYTTGKYDSGGMVWFGAKPATKEDIAALRDRFGDKVRIDKASTVGKKHPGYTTFYRTHKGDPQYSRHIKI